jgi:hypothetical protein
MKKKKSKDEVEAQISEVMSMMAQRSVEARKAAWGKREFKKKMREWGKLGGRPRKDENKEKENE